VKRVFGLHLAANAVLLALIYFWLGIRDARAWQVLLTLVLGTAIVASALWLHAATWHWMVARDWRVPRVTFVKFAVGFAIFVVVWWLLSLIPVSRGALWTASLATLKSRKPVTPESIERIFQAVLWLVRWFALPILLFRQWRNFRFWGLLAAVLLLSVYLPERLVHWTPGFKNTAAEVVSVLLRWGLAYGLAVAGWLAVLWFARKPSVKSAHV